MGRSQDADIHGNHFLAAHTADLLSIEHAQELRLKRHREFGDFVQKQRPAGRLLEDPQVPGRGGLRAGDRKSTRLNSSHLVISYAVFCLKKKKKTLDNKKNIRTQSRNKHNVVTP